MAAAFEEIDITAEYFKLKAEGNQHFHNDDYDKAKDCYLKAIGCNPPKEIMQILYCNLATIYSKQPPDWDEVIRHTNLALELDPNDVRALFGKYRAYDATGKYQEALEIITSICCVRPNDEAYMKSLDNAIIRVADLETEELVKNRLPCPKSIYSINAYFKTFSCDPIVEWWNGKVPIGVDEESVLCQLMKSHSLGETAGDTGDTKPDLSGFTAAVWDLHRQNYSKIMDHCTEELGNDGSKFKAESHLLRGTFRMFGLFHEADVLADLEPITSGSVPASDEIQTSAWIKRGEFSTLFKNRAEIDLCFQKALSLAPNNPDVGIAYCNSLMEIDQPREAYVQISSALEKLPLNPANFGILCFLKFRLDALTGLPSAPIQSLALFESYLAKYPNCAELYMARGHLFKDVREVCAAYMEFRKACELEPENFGFAVNMIMMKFEATVDLNACVRELKDIIAKDDTNVSAYEALATVHISVGPDFQAAFDAIEKGLKVSKSRHDFQTFAILKHTAEVREKIVTSYARSSAAYGRRYEELMTDIYESAMD